MCGLALAAHKSKRCGTRAYELFNKQRARGTQGFGYIGITNGVITSIERSKTEEGIKPQLLKEKADLVLLHHRLPTSTDNTLGTTHPIFVQNDELEYDYYVMHNGGVSNDNELKAKHEKLGYEYTTEFREVTHAVHLDGRTELLGTTKSEFNDSECLAIEAARFLEGKQNKMENKGGAAFFVVQVIKGTEKVEAVYYAQNYGRQLGIQHKKGWTLIASQHGKEVPHLKLFKMDPKTYAIKELDIDMDDGIKLTPSPYNYNQSHSHVSLPSAREAGPATDLVNAYYTAEEVHDSGHPMSEFFPGNRMLIGDRWHATFVPKVYSGKDPTTRPLFRDEYYWVEVEDPKPTKSQERLEELAMKYARKQHEFELLADDWVESRVQYQEYYAGKEALEREMETLEADMSCLGFSEHEVEETVQTAQELVDFEYSEVVNRA